MKALAWVLWIVLIVSGVTFFCLMILMATLTDGVWRIGFLVAAIAMGRDLKQCLFDLPPPWKLTNL